MCFYDNRAFLIPSMKTLKKKQVKYGGHIGIPLRGFVDYSCLGVELRDTIDNTFHVLRTWGKKGLLLPSEGKREANEWNRALHCVMG